MEGQPGTVQSIIEDLSIPGAGDVALDTVPDYGDNLDVPMIEKEQEDRKRVKDDSDPFKAKQAKKHRAWSTFKNGLANVPLLTIGMVECKQSKKDCWVTSKECEGLSEF